MSVFFISHAKGWHSKKGIAAYILSHMKVLECSFSNQLKLWMINHTAPFLGKTQLPKIMCLLVSASHEALEYHAGRVLVCKTGGKERQGQRGRRLLEANVLHHSNF